MALFQFPPEKLAALSGIYDSSGLQVVFDVMEGFCNESENDYLAIPPSKPAEVLATHAIMHAQRIYFQKVAAKIDFLAAEARGGEKQNVAEKRSK